MDGNGVAPRWMPEVLLAEAFGWTYDEIREAPDWFVQRCLLYINEKNRRSNREK